MSLHSKLLPAMKKSPEKLSGNNLADYLIKHPDTTGNIKFRQFSSLCWVKLLSHCPQFAEQCDFSKMPVDSATQLVIAQPMFLDRFDLTKLNWKEILCAHPNLIKHCPEQKLKRFRTGAWGEILRVQPELAKYAPLHRFSDSELCELISYQPQFADTVQWEKETNPLVWKKAILLQPDTLLACKKEWKKYFNFDGLNPRDIACLLRDAPHLEAITDFSIFGRLDWNIILAKQPHFIKYCDVNKHFNNLPLHLLSRQPQLAEHFNWEKVNHLPYETIIDMLRSNRSLVYKILHSLKFERKDLVIILQDYPELLLKLNRTNYSFCDNTSAFAAADFFDFDQTGLDSVCNVAYCYLEKKTNPPGGIYKCSKETENLSAEEFMLMSTMDSVNAKRYLIRKIGSWQFFDDLFELDSEAIYRFIPKTEAAFLWSIAADEQGGIKYLDQIENIADISDKNGNTLLHAALLRAVFTDIENACNQGTSCRKYYDYLVARGGNPDKKNKKGVSCNDIFVIIRKKLQQLTEVINENSK